MGDAGRHPNIKILANTTVDKVEGEAGDFTVTVTRNPRYVDEDLCTGCRTCATYCPAKTNNPFNENLSSAKAIDIWCPQAIPAATAIDKESCLYFEGKCTICKSVCETGAIDFTQKRKKGIMHVGAIIVSPGYDIFDATKTNAYGYGRLKNVMNSLELERILSAAGPSKGSVLRRSDGKIPSKIAWLQCVGSRDTGLGNTYCSSVCCTYALKQMILVKNHYPKTEVTVFHNDIRTFGKGFEDFYNRARNMEGAHFVRRRISSVKENRKNNNLLVTYASDDHQIVEEEFDMVILSVGMSPGKDNADIAERIGLKLNKHGFCETNSFMPTEVENRPGIFPAASFTGPMDIPDSISSASGAGAMAAELLQSQRGTLAQLKKYPDEIDVEGQEPRIGVFVCNCGTNIGGVADVPSLVDYASSLQNVVHYEEQSISCGSDALQKITDAIIAKKLNRIVVSACTPRDHETVFREALREAGLNPYLLEIANIREHVTWVNFQDREEVNQKAKDTIGMAVARARNLVPLQEMKLSVIKKGLVLGGGLAGMKAALSLAHQGFEVQLVEKENELGGQLRNIHYTLDGLEVQPFLKQLVSDVEKEDKITVYKGYELKSHAGYIGNFTSTITRTGAPDEEPIELQHGVVIVATGGQLLRPDEYHLGQTGKVVTQQDMEQTLASGSLPPDVKQVAMIQCVGARNEERGYCSRICCGVALKNALKIKELNPDTEVIVFFRDLRSYSFKEDYYLEAREKGVLFIQYEPENKPEVDLNGDNLSLRYYDSTMNMAGEINPDLVVLSTPVIADANKDIAQMLRLPVTGDGFFMEAHLKLKPLDFATDGMFLCGAAQYPKYIPETINQANGAALRAATVLAQDSVVASGAICEVNEPGCIGCGICERVCPYHAINLEEEEDGKLAKVVPAACKGCGVCIANCPTNCLTLNHFTDEQIFSQIHSAFNVPIKKSKPKILAFLCNWCGYAAADLAGVSRIPYASNTRTIRVMCSGRVNAKFIYDALLSGMDAVLIVGCHPEDCHYITGVTYTMKVVPAAQKQLEKIGIDPGRVILEFASAAEGAQFASIVNNYNAAVEKLGHLELTDEQREQLTRLRDKKTEAKRKKKGTTESVAVSDE